MEFIPLAKPDIQTEDIHALNEVLLSGMLVQGSKVLELEKHIGAFINCENVIAASNGTATLHLALVALGIEKGDEVIVPAFSYIATANVVELVGATPIFVDVEADTFNIDISKIESVITPKTKAIIPVHEFGLACDIEGIMKIAKKHSLFVIEDAACALGATQNGKFTGTFGDLGSFSLHPRKAISSGEGGLLTTGNINLANKLRILRNHGIEMIEGKMEFVMAGFNYRLTDFQAALVNSQLNRLNKILKYKTELADLYFTLIRNPKIKLPVVPADRNHTWQTFHIVLDESLDRDKIIDHLKSKNIGTNYGAQCIPAQKFYKAKYKIDCNKLYPNAMRAYKKGLAIPVYEKLTTDNISYIAEQLNQL
jgi:perosamine synthetase